MERNENEWNKSMKILRKMCLQTEFGTKISNLLVIILISHYDNMYIYFELIDYNITNM